MDKRHLLTIDAVRFVAALLVAYYHLGFKPFADPTDGYYPLISKHWLPNGDFHPAAVGWIGVQVFFVISGFVIAFSAQGEGLWTYLRRRVLRLAPAVWIIVPICLGIDILYFHLPLASEVSRTLRTIGFSPAGPWIIGQFWTLPIEMVFYSCVAALIATSRIKYIEGLGLFLGLISLAYWAWATAVGFAPNHGQYGLQLLLLQHGVYFAIGITIFRARTEGLDLKRIIFLAACCIPAVIQISSVAHFQATGVDHVFSTLGAVGIWAVLVALIVVSTLRTSAAPQSEPGKVAGLIRMLGLATYPLYLLHAHVGGIALIFMLRNGVSYYAAVVSALLLSVAVALAIASIIEPRVRKALAMLIDRLQLSFLSYKLKAVRTA
jgi:exopolysaccharide production protein ExoZ